LAGEFAVGARRFPGRRRIEHMDALARHVGEALGGEALRGRSVEVEQVAGLPRHGWAVFRDLGGST
jgi:hypothetical protein